MVEGNGAARVAVHQGLQLHLRRALHLRPVSLAAPSTSRPRRPKKRARIRRTLRSRSPWATTISPRTCAPASSRPRKKLRHADRHRRQAAARASPTCRRRSPRCKAPEARRALVSGHEKGALTAVRQIAEQKIDVPMLAMTHCDSADMIAEKVGAAAEYTLCASQWAPHARPTRTSGSARRRITPRPSRQTYGHEAPYQAAESTAVRAVYADAFKRAGIARHREGARRPRRHRHRDLLRPHQVRRDRQEHRQADGALLRCSGGTVRGGGAEPSGRGEGGHPRPRLGETSTARVPL